MNKEEIKQAYYNAKTKKDFLKSVCIEYKHMNGSKINIEILKLLDFLKVSEDDISAKAFKERYLKKCTLEYNKNPKICKYCGSIINYIRSTKSDFCSSKCAKSYSNSKRILSEETKNKIGKSVKMSILSKSKRRDKITLKLKKLHRTCCICGSDFIVPIIKRDRYSKTTTCSDECKRKLLSINSKNSIEKRKENGTFIGQKTRNIISYSEKFWKSVLDNNHIQYIREFYIDKYFLDFYIEYNNIKIDLEIDGKQHKYPERALSDKIRDEYIKSKDIFVYRIEWNEIKSKKGKELMKEKIDDFLKFIKIIS